MKAFTLSVANGTRGNKTNKVYATQATITTPKELKQAVLYDHVAGLFTDNERGINNFISADCILMDCDNDHTENAEAWFTPEKLFARLPNVEVAVVYSKSHMKDKDEYSARPRFHCYFALSEPVSQATRIRELKEKLLVIVPEFDPNAKDAARFFFGVQEVKPPMGNEGNLCIDEFITIHGVDATYQLPNHEHYNATHDTKGQEETQNIHEGNRNDYIFRVALDALKAYGEAKARKIFDDACEKCTPPLSVQECTRTWESALKTCREFQAKFTEKKKTLTLQAIEQALKALNISVKFDVIRKELEVSDLPQDSVHVPEAYKSLNAYDKRQANAELLPLFLTSYLKEKGFTFSESFLIGSIAAIANTHRFNPVLDIIQATHWDGEDRISDLCRVLGIQNNEHYCGFVRKWLHQAVSLALNDDGAMNSEFVLVLQGAQGLGKTNFFRRLAIRPEWFVEGAVIDMRNKDSIIESTECWICELGELDSTLKKEQASLKAFITRNFDTYRRPYARKSDKIERRTCFAATVNPETANRDTTGSRRFVYIHIEAIDKHYVYNIMTPDWCSQLWRQVYDALYMTQGRESFYLTDEERAFAETSNEDFRVLLPAETELLDLLDWDSEPECWRYSTASEVRDECSLRKYEANKIGEALTQLCKRFKGAEKKRSNGRTMYRVPSKRRDLVIYCN